MGTKGERTRQEIIDRATGAFHRKGFKGTSLSDLLKETGVTKGSLYFHFPGKNEVGLEVLRQERNRFMAFIDEALSGATPGARLDHFFHRALEKHRDCGFVGGCLFGNTALEASDADPAFAEPVAEVFSAWIDKLQRTIESAQQTEEVRSDLPARQLAEFAVSVLEGGIMQSRLGKDEGPLARSIETLRALLGLHRPPGEEKD